MQRFEKHKNKEEMSNTIYLGAGSNLGTKKYISENFQQFCCPDSILSTTTGYMKEDAVQNNNGENHICGVEVVKVELKPEKNVEDTLRNLLRFFFRFHDPTQIEKNFRSIDEECQHQTSSFIFVTCDTQQLIAEEVRDDLQKLVKLGKVRSYIATTVRTRILSTFSFTFCPKVTVTSSNFICCKHFLRFHTWPEAYYSTTSIELDRPTPTIPPRIRNNSYDPAPTTKMTSHSIPILTQPKDVLKHGLNCDNLAASAKKLHYVDTLQRAHDPMRERLDLDAVRRLYGSGLAMTLLTERRLAAAAGGRLPGMDATPDSHAMLDAVTGNDLQIGFEDILNRSEFRTTEDSFRSVQHKMEAKFGLSS